MRTRLHFGAFLAANVVAVGALGFFALPRLMTHDAPASLTQTPQEQVVRVCPWASQREFARVLRQL